MDWWIALLIGLAGFAASFINAVVGSGTLVTFPTLLALLPLTPYPIAPGMLAKTANITNSVGLVPGGFTSMLGYRDEIRATAHRLKLFVPATALGAITGAWLLLALPGRAFNAVVPLLILLALLLIVFGRRIQAWTAAHHGTVETPLRRRLCAVAMFVCGVYGAYFGAAQGILMVGFMNVLLDEELQHINGIKTVLGTLNNTLAVVVFLVVDRSAIIWPVAGVLAVFGLVGAYAGARVGRSLSPAVLRGVIVAIGVVALVRMAPDMVAALVG